MVKEVINPSQLIVKIAADSLFTAQWFIGFHTEYCCMVDIQGMKFWLRMLVKVDFILFTRKSLVLDQDLQLIQGIRNRPYDFFSTDQGILFRGQCVDLTDQPIVHGFSSIYHIIRFIWQCTTQKC